MKRYCVISSSLVLGTTSVDHAFDEFTVSPNHPFYINSSGSLETHPVSPQFDGTGFLIWRKNILTTLSAKNKLGLITGRVPKLVPESPSMRDAMTWS